MASWWDDITGWLNHRAEISNATFALRAATKLDALNVVWDALPETLRSDALMASVYASRRKEIQTIYQDPQELFEDFISGALSGWLKKVDEYSKADPAKAKENLAKLSAHVVEVAAASASIDVALGMWPGSAGAASSTNTKELLKWLGFGAVLTAVAHDPVKIGLLRPYQDLLEQTFRNRRPGDADLFTAYQQRSLSSTKIEDVNSITDVLMTTIEKENDTFYDAEISKWGYSEYFSNSLKDAATKTLSFGNLMALAKQGRLNRGMAIFSLWGYGLDRRLMKIALEALDQANETANYEGFRAQIEPAYVEGAIDEASLMDYWKKLHIPQDVQNLMIPRFRKKRETYAQKQAGGTAQKERDLTVSQVQQAYQNLLLDRAKAQNMMLDLAYSLDEAKILLDLAELRRKLPSAQTLKRLPLTDYEKAQKNGILKIEDVLDRMKGEYTQDDIALEKQLLEIGKA